LINENKLSKEEGVMDDALQRFLSDHFERLESSISKLESSIGKIYDKLEATNERTSSNSKDIERLKDEYTDIKNVFDDKLKGFRIGHDACQSNCKMFREDIIKQMDAKDSALALKLKNWILATLVTAVTGFGASILLKFIGGK
jgi:predicted  nucleic acid-binding Zn-ribbon protein